MVWSEFITHSHMAKVIRLGEKSAPKFPKFQSNSLRGFFASLLGIILWIGLLIVFVVSLYTQWFIRNLARILNAIHPGTYDIPFIAGILCVLFLFPFTLIVVLIGQIIQSVHQS